MKSLSLNQTAALSMAMAASLGSTQVDLWGNARGKHKLGSQWSHDKDARKARNKQAKKSRSKNRS